MKNIITLLFLLLTITLSAQIETYTINSGQYAIYNSGSSENVTVETRYTYNTAMSYKNFVAVVDTIMAVESLTSLDTLSNFTRPNGKILGISFPDSAKYTTSLTVPDDSIIYYTKMTNGNNAAIEGADVITGLTFPFSDTWTYNLTLPISNSSYQNFRQVVDSDIDGSQIRIKITGSTATGGTEIDGVSIGKRILDTDDFNGTPTRITFNGADTIYLAIGDTAWSDWVAFDAEQDSIYLVHTYMKSPTRYQYVGSTGGGNYRSTVTDDNTLTQTVSYGTKSTSLRIISAFEVRTPTWQKSGITTQPNVITLNDTVGIPQTSIANCDTVGQWFWDSATDIFYVYSDTDPSGNVYIGQRKNLINLSDKTHITLKNLTVLRSNESANPSVGLDWTSAGIYSNGASSITIDNCEIKWSGFIGTYFTNISDLVIKNSTFLYNGNSWMDGENVRIFSSLTTNSNFTFTNNINSYAGENGILLTAQVKENIFTNINVSGNTFEHCFDTGIYLQRADSAVISDNTFDSMGDSIDGGEDYSIGIGNVTNLDIYDNTITNQRNNDAIQLWSDLAMGDTKNVNIYNNYINNIAAGNGIGMNLFDDETGSNINVYYNLIANVDKNGISMNHKDLGSPSSINVFNNTIYESGDRSINTSLNFPYVAKNNIMYKSVTGGYNIDAFSATSGITSSNNLWNTTASGVLKYIGVAYTLSTITNFEATAQTGDPLFTDAANGDFTLQTGSPAIGNGVDVGITTDILGNPVNPLSVTIGAYQFITP